MRKNNAAMLASVVMAVGTFAAGGMAAAGVAASPPSPAQNDPINSDTNKTEKAQTPGHTSFTEGQAKGHIEKAGYTDVSGLKKTPEGFWTGSAKKGGKSVHVSVDYKGAVAAK